MKKLVIDIDTEGKVSVDAHGFPGQSCQKAIDPIADALGEKIEVKKKSHEVEQEEEVKCQA